MLARGAQGTVSSPWLITVPRLVILDFRDKLIGVPIRPIPEFTFIHLWVLHPRLITIL
jgi:hypothetical protein